MSLPAIAAILTGASQGAAQGINAYNAMQQLKRENEEAPLRQRLNALKLQEAETRMGALPDQLKSEKELNRLRLENEKLRNAALPSDIADIRKQRELERQKTELELQNLPNKLQNEQDRDSVLFDNARLQNAELRGRAAKVQSDLEDAQRVADARKFYWENTGRIPESKLIQMTSEKVKDIKNPELLNTVFQGFKEMSTEQGKARYNALINGNYSGYATLSGVQLPPGATINFDRNNPDSPLTATFQDGTVQPLDIPLYTITADMQNGAMQYAKDIKQVLDAHVTTRAAHAATFAKLTSIEAGVVSDIARLQAATPPAKLDKAGLDAWSLKHDEALSEKQQYLADVRQQKAAVKGGYDIANRDIKAILDKQESLSQGLPTKPKTSGTSDLGQVIQMPASGQRVQTVGDAELEGVRNAIPKIDMMINDVAIGSKPGMRSNLESWKRLLVNPEVPESDKVQIAATIERILSGK